MVVKRMSSRDGPVEIEDDDDNLREQIAHARLIAAAPELLEALKGCVRALEAHDATVATRLDMHEAAALVRGQDVIAKATGETP